MNNRALPPDLERRMRIIVRTLIRNGISKVAFERDFLAGEMQNRWFNSIAYANGGVLIGDEYWSRLREVNQLRVCEHSDMTLRFAIDELQNAIELEVDSMAAWNEAASGRSTLTITSDGEWEFSEDYTLYAHGDNPKFADGRVDIRDYI